jgi:hypothetical protein
VFASPAELPGDRVPVRLMGGELLDGLARALAEPMPRRRAVRTVVASLAALAVPGLSPRLTSATAAPERRGGSAVAKCPDGSECRNEGEVCCPMPSPLSGQFNCCETAAHCCCGNRCCDPERQICVCTGRKGVGGACVDKACGPNVTEPLMFALYRVEAAFAGWSVVGREGACASLYALAPISWDIRELGPGGRATLVEKYGGPCANCGHAVQIGSECHFAGSANYVVFGTMMRLCRNFYRGRPPSVWFGEEAMNIMIVAHKSQISVPMIRTGEEAANLDASIAWAKAGYRGWPKQGPIPPGDRDNCKPSCGKYYTGPGFTVNWLPEVIEP